MKQKANPMIVGVVVALVVLVSVVFIRSRMAGGNEGGSDGGNDGKAVIVKPDNFNNPKLAQPSSDGNAKSNSAN